jgi:signal transduction histidine kinase
VKRIVLFILLLLIGANVLLGQDTLQLAPGFRQLDLLEWGQLYRTPDTALGAGELNRLPEQEWISLSRADGAFFAGKDLLWIRVFISNSAAAPLPLLVQSKEVRTNRIAFFWAPAAGPPIASPTMGDYLPFGNRMIGHPTYLFPITLEASQEGVLYICYDKREETITIQPQLWEPAAFEERDRSSRFLMVLFLGALTCLAVVMVVLGLVARQGLLLSFALYITSGMLMVFVITGYGAMYLWPNHPYWNGLGYLFLIFFHVSLLEMGGRYLGLRQGAPHLHRMFQLAQVLLLLVFMPAVLSFPVLEGFFKIWLGRSGLMLLLLINLGIIIACIGTYRREGRGGALLFLLAFMFSLIALALFEVEQLGSLNTPWSMELTLLFMLLDLLTLGALFGHYLRRTFMEHTQLSEALSRSQLKAANALLLGQYKERKRLSQELHDGISIQLALLKMRLSGEPSGQLAEVEPVLEDLTRISEGIRNFTHAISPALLEEEGLVMAIEALAGRVADQAGLEVSTHLPEAEEAQGLSHLQYYSVFLVVQELLSNTLKHAGATRIRLSLEFTDACTLHYCDNGKGVSADAVDAGLGLSHIKDRAALLGGTFDYYPADSGGSCFRFLFPVSMVS